MWGRSQERMSSIYNIKDPINNMRLPVIFLFLLIAIAACKDNKPKSQDIIHAQWLPLDSSSKYILYNSDEKMLNDADSITISFAGKLSHDSITFSNLDSFVCSNITGYKFGKFTFIDSSLGSEIDLIKRKMRRHSTAFIKWYPDTTLKNEHFTLTVFLKKSADTLEDIRLLEKIKQESFILSCSYISKSLAPKKFSGDNADTTFLSFLDNNPLPASIEFTVKPEYFNTDSLKNIAQKI